MNSCYRRIIFIIFKAKKHMNEWIVFILRPKSICAPFHRFFVPVVHTKFCWPLFYGNKKWGSQSMKLRILNRQIKIIFSFLPALCLQIISFFLQAWCYPTSSTDTVNCERLSSKLLLNSCVPERLKPRLSKPSLWAKTFMRQSKLCFVTINSCPREAKTEAI